MSIYDVAKKYLSLMIGLTFKFHCKNYVEFGKKNNCILLESDKGWLIVTPYWTKF